MDKNKNKIIEKIRTLFKDKVKEKSLRVLGSELGMSYSTINRFMQGLTPDLDNLQRFAKYCGEEILLKSDNNDNTEDAKQIIEKILNAYFPCNVFGKQKYVVEVREILAIAENENIKIDYEVES